MVTLKTKEEIEKMRAAGKVAAVILEKLENSSVPGTSTLQLNTIAEEEIQKAGMKPGFKTVEGYKFAICTTVNAEVVHGLPSDYKLKSGDLLSIDLGVMNSGLHTDVATSFEVRGKDQKPVNSENNHFLEVGKETLVKAMHLVKAGVRVGDISNLIQSSIEDQGYSIVRELTGHGVGHELHEDPLIPGFGENGQGPILEEGMTIAVEVIYTMGKRQVGILDDGWTIVSRDGSLAAVFEHTMLVTKTGPVVLTQS